MEIIRGFIYLLLHQIPDRIIKKDSKILKSKPDYYDDGPPILNTVILLHLLQHIKRTIHKSEEQLEIHFYQTSTIFDSRVSFTFPFIFFIQGFLSHFPSFFEKETKHEKIDHHHQHDISDTSCR